MAGRSSPYCSHILGRTPERSNVILPTRRNRRSRSARVIRTTLSNPAGVIDGRCHVWKRDCRTTTLRLPIRWGGERSTP